MQLKSGKRLTGRTSESRRLETSRCHKLMAQHAAPGKYKGVQAHLRQCLLPWPVLKVSSEAYVVKTRPLPQLASWLNGVLLLCLALSWSEQQG